MLDASKIFQPTSQNFRASRYLQTNATWQRSEPFWALVLVWPLFEVFWQGLFPHNTAVCNPILIPNHLPFKKEDFIPFGQNFVGIQRLSLFWIQLCAVGLKLVGSLGDASYSSWNHISFFFCSNNTDPNVINENITTPSHNLTEKLNFKDNPT